MLGGKGGVGKTSSAASLGVRLGNEAGPTLVVSTDPAHSLSDSLDQVCMHTITQTLTFVMAGEKIDMLVKFLACALERVQNPCIGRFSIPSPSLLPLPLPHHPPP